MALAVEKRNIQLEIQRLQRLLNLKAKYFNFNFQHPEVQSLSKKLDELVVIAMKEKSTN